ASPPSPSCSPVSPSSPPLLSLQPPTAAAASFFRAAAPSLPLFFSHPPSPGPLRCGPCAVWPRQQTWLCAVPLVMGFVGLGLSLMLLKWIVVGSVQDYVPTDLVDPKSINGQDPIFLSKPSAMPKGPDISTATTSLAPSTTAMISMTTPLAGDGTAPAPRTRSGPPANHSANGSNPNGDGNRAPHLHNRVGTRISGTTVTTSATRATRLTPAPSGKEVTPRSNVRKGSSTSNGRNGAANSNPGQTSPTVTTTTSTTTTAISKGTAKVPPTTTSQPAVPLKPTSRWNQGRPGRGPATRPHHRFRTRKSRILVTSAVRVSAVFKGYVLNS
uniref:Uncharacterized protein n=1 Tax=Cyprinodon variegatus TaxID=28743 RepID=A0A3Q2DZP4_CYPVA